MSREERRQHLNDALNADLSSSRRSPSPKHQHASSQRAPQPPPLPQPHGLSSIHRQPLLNHTAPPRHYVPSHGYPYMHHGRGRGRQFANTGFRQPAPTAVVGWTPRVPVAANKSNTGPPPPPPPPTESPKRSLPSSFNGSATVAATTTPTNSSAAAPASILMPAGPAANGTPSWLKGAYRGGASSSTSLPSSVASVSANASAATTSAAIPASIAGSDAEVGKPTVEAWCKARVESMQLVVDGGNADSLPGLKKVMEDLEYAKISLENDLIRKARRERWRCEERMLKTKREIVKSQREVWKIEVHSQHVDAKIARLRSYAQFIENKWQNKDGRSVNA